MILIYDSAMIGEIHKAILYRNEQHRIRRNGRGLTFAGDNHVHYLTHEQGAWRCDCAFYRGRETCSHTRTLEWLAANNDLHYACVIAGLDLTTTGATAFGEGVEPGYVTSLTMMIALKSAEAVTYKRRPHQGFLGHQPLSGRQQYRQGGDHLHLSYEEGAT